MHPTGLGKASRNNELKRALRADSAYFLTILNHGTNSTIFHFNSAVSAADLNDLAKSLNNAVYEDKNAEIGEDQIHTTPAMADSPVIKVSREKLRAFLVRVEVNSTVETAQCEKVRALLRTMVEGSVCEVFNTKYYTTIEAFLNFSFLFVVSVIIDTILRGVLD